jgi:hypothetical protein
MDLATGYIRPLQSNGAAFFIPGYALATKHRFKYDEKERRKEYTNEGLETARV